MKEIVLKGRLKFTEEYNKTFDRDFVASLQKSSAFEYGNGTCVVIEFGAFKDGRIPDGVVIDTRYEKMITTEKDFKKFLEDWFNKNYCPHKLTFKKNLKKY